LDQSAYFTKEISLDPKAVEKHFKNKETRSHLDELNKSLKGADFSNPGALEMILLETAQKLGVQAGNLIHPTRVAITGSSISPGIFEVISLLGKEIVLKRLQYVIIHFDNLITK